MSYLSTLSASQKANITYIATQLKAKGITNNFTRAAILSVASKESAFITQEEKGYQNTPNARIRKIFGKFVGDLDETQLTALKADPKKFFDKIYGNRYGNGPEEGYKYRGRGFNQLTFKGNYKKVGGAIGFDLVANPDLMNQVSVATAAIIQYFREKISAAPKEAQLYYKFKDINGFKSLEDAVGAIYHANAGWGKSPIDIEADRTGGRKKAMNRAPEFLELVSKL